MNAYYRYFFFTFLFLFLNQSAHAQQSQVVISAVGDCDSLNDCNTYIFTASNIRSEYGDISGSYRIFWYFGDGEYIDYVDTLDDTNPNTFVTHIFNQSGDFEIYMEAVPRYEIDKPPKRFQYSGTFSPTCTDSTCGTAKVSLPSGPFYHTSNRDFVSNQKVSYLLTYANLCGPGDSPANPVSGTIFLRYDSKQLKPDDIRPISEPSANITFTETEEDNDIEKMKWVFSQLPRGSTWNIIIPFVVNSSMNVGDSLNIVIGVNMAGSFNNCIYNPDSMSVDFPVKNSHDPNDLIADIDKSCNPRDVNIVEYVIRFKNNGDGPATRVLIKDEMPEYFDISTIETIYPLSSGLPPPHSNPKGREIRWELSEDYLRGRSLKGTRQKEFGKSIFLEDCVDSLVFTVERIPNLPSLPIDSCDAIVNRAEIIFDCNTPFYTNPYIFRFGCDTTIAGTPLACECIEQPSIIKTVSGTYIPGGNPIQLRIDTSHLPKLDGIKFVWYPSEGLNNITTMEPLASPIKKTDYFLIASNPGSCERTIYQNTVDVPCDLKIIPEITCMNGIKSVAAKVDSDSRHLQWQDCTTFGNDIEISNIKNRYLYLSVVDTITNCFATIDLEVVCPDEPRSRLAPPGSNDSSGGTPSIPLILLLVVGGIIIIGGLLKYFR